MGATSITGGAAITGIGAACIVPAFFTEVFFGEVGAIGLTSKITSATSDGLRLIRNGFVETAYHGLASLVKTPIESIWNKCQNRNLSDIIITQSAAPNNDQNYTNLHNATATIVTNAIEEAEVFEDQNSNVITQSRIETPTAKPLSTITERSTTLSG